MFELVSLNCTRHRRKIQSDILEPSPHDSNHKDLNNFEGILGEIMLRDLFKEVSDSFVVGLYFSSYSTGHKDFTAKRHLHPCRRLIFTGCVVLFNQTDRARSSFNSNGNASSNLPSAVWTSLNLAGSAEPVTAPIAFKSLVSSRLFTHRAHAILMSRLLQQK